MNRAIVCGLPGYSPLRWVIGRTLGWSGVLALSYHRVGDGSGSLYDRALWSTSAETFAEQVRYCKRHLDVISPADLPQVVASRRGRYVLITFDDGYRDNYEVAFPILKAEGVPATFFVATGFIDSPRLPWWDEIAWMVRTSPRGGMKLHGWLDAPVRFDDPDREGGIRHLLRVYKSLATENTEAFLNAIASATGSGRYGTGSCERLWMTWSMLRQMRAAGMTIGGHTINHPVLARASREVQRHEIEGCSRRIADRLGQPMRYFSYPVGGSGAFDAVTRECLRDAGVDYAFSNRGGFWRLGPWDAYDMRRVPIEPYVTREWFRSILDLPQLFA